ncbi:putative tetratricopeptide-like helical domain superfamily [Dioscorea sansibarensis]
MMEMVLLRDCVAVGSVPCFYSGMNYSLDKVRRRQNSSIVDCSVLSGSAFWLRRRKSIVTVFSSKFGLLCEESVGLSFSMGESHQSLNRDEVDCSSCMTPLIPQTMDKPNAKPVYCLSSLKQEKGLGLSKRKLHFLEERDEGLLSKRILRLSRSNKSRSALELFVSMEIAGLQPNAHACNSLLACLVRNGSLDDALEVFEMMRKKEIATSHTYSLMLKAVAGVQGCDSALRMFKALEGEVTAVKNFDVIVYNTMISVCGKVKNWFEAEILWRKLKQNAVTGTMLTYDLLVSIFVQCDQTELALEAYHEMIQNGLEPSEDIMKAMIASCTKDGEWALALRVFEKMMSASIKPNAIAYNSMINCLGKAGKYDLAFRIYGLMKNSEHKPDAYTWSALLSSLYRSGQYDDALRFFKGIRKDQGDRLNAYLYNAALLSCQKLALWEHSLQLLWQMETSGIPMLTESYNHVIFTCEAARNPKVALQVYHHMIHNKCAPDLFTHLSLVRSCVWGSLWKEAKGILESVAPNASLYNAIIHGLLLRGKTTMAKKWYDRMCEIGLKPDGKTRALMLQLYSNERVRPHPRYKVWKHS